MKRKKSLETVCQALAEVYEAVKPLNTKQRRCVLEVAQKLLECCDALKDFK